MTAATLLAVALALLVVPGAAICLAAGSTWRDAVAAGPALTLAVVAAGCVVTAAADMPWVPASAGAIALVALLCAGLVGPAARQLVGRARRRSRDEDDDEAAGPPAAHARRADTGHARRPVHGRRDAARHDTPGGRGAGRWLSDVVVVVRRFETTHMSSQNSLLYHLVSRVSWLPLTSFVTSVPTVANPRGRRNGVWRHDPQSSPAGHRHLIWRSP